MTGPQDPYPSSRPVRAGGQVYSILAIVFGVAAVLFLPVIFGPVGAVLAYVGKRRGEPLWKAGMAVAIGGMVLGIVLGAVLLNASD